MRVHSVSIENITSLKGKHVIDFDEILHGEDLFAITGPTGSGKSSILAAISLALYNSNYKEGLGPIELITQGEDFGKVELSFSTGNNRYKSVWECRLAQKNGTRLKTPKLQHTFYLDDEIIDLNGEEILGLSFDQFSKTIILNQGQFSRFLTSKYKDRRDILEKLYDSKTLALLGIRLNEKIKDVKGEIQGIELALENILPVTKDEMDLLILDLEQTKKEKKNLGIFCSLYKMISSEVRDYSRCIQNVQNNRAKKTKYVDTVSKSITESNQIKHTVDQSNKALQIKKQESNEVRPRLIKCIELSNKLSAKKRELLQNHERAAKNVKSIAHKEELQEKAIAEKEAITKGLALFENSHPALFIDDSVFDQYSSIVKDIRSIAGTQATKVESLQNFSNQQNEMKTGLESLKGNIQKKEDELSAHSLTAASESLKEWIKKHDLEINKLKGIIETKEKSARKKEQYLTEVDQYKSELSKNKLNEKSIAKKEKDIQEKIKESKIELELALTKIKLKELERSIAFIQAESLESGRCLVCEGDISSISPPAASKSNEDDQSVIHLQGKIRELELEESKLNGTLHSSIAATQITSDKLKSSQDNLTELPDNKDLGAADDIRKKLDLSIKWSILVPETHRTLQKDQVDFKVLLDKKEKQSILMAKIEAEQEDDSIALYKLISEIKTSFPSYPDNPEMLCTFFEEDTSVFHRIKRGIDKEKYAISSVDKLKNDIETLVTLKKEDLERSKNIESEISLLESSILEDYNFEDPSGTLQNLSDELEQMSKSHAALREELVSINRSIDTHNQFISNLEETLKALDLEKNLIEGNLFSIVVPESLNEIDTSYTKVFLEKVKSNSTSADPESQYKLIEAFDTGILPATVDQIDEQLKCSTKKFHQLETTLGHYREAENKSADLKDSYKLLTATLNRFQLLNEIIGKQEFRDYALSIIERELVFGANNELKKICDGRYVLKQIPSKLHKFEFFIIDNYSGGMERKVSTLSGGETFLVSLAMAMALSEMTRGQCEIDSFFIDEGFGSLDEDAIDDALDTLMQIRSRGKRIGIISHVQKLTERISVNINLIKTDLGESSIQIIS
ncbi:MAG: SMC family ATPase [Bacteriovoracaceae bacterium]|nr:SMC family ATPase [Bacteriovoracaceae bacterium]